jgi:hypothetical protein
MRPTPRQRKHFEALCQIEPRLQGLHERAKAVKDNRRQASFCANAVWYGYSARHPRKGLRGEMAELVGWIAEKPELRTTTAYDVAYHVVYDVLPGCRACICIPH